MKDLSEIKFDFKPEGELPGWDMSKTYRNVSIFFGSVFAFLFLLMLLIFFDDSAFDESATDGIWVLFWVFAAMFIIFSFHHQARVGGFIKKFAEKNDLGYKKSVRPDSAFLNFSSVKTGTYGMEHVVEGFFKGHPTRFFVYGQRPYVIWETKFDKIRFPHIFLRSKKMVRLGKKAKNETRVSLKKDFNDSFRLYVARGYEIEVLQIFTPEVLQMLCDKSSEFSIEFAGNSMYIYDNTVVKNNKQLKELFEVARGIFDSAGPLINRLDDDFNVLHEQYGKKG